MRVRLHVVEYALCGRIPRPTSTAPYQGRQVFQLSQKGWKSVRDNTGQLEEKVVADGLNNEGWIVWRDCRIAPAAASSLSEGRRHRNSIDPR